MTVAMRTAIRHAEPKSLFVSTAPSFWKHKDLDYISVMAGSFDRPSDLHGESHIFVDDKGDYYQIDDDLPKYAKSGGGVVVAGD